MQNTQNQNQALDPATLRQTLEGLGLLEVPAKAGGLFKAHVAASDAEETQHAVNRLRASFGWEPHGRVTQNTERAIRVQVAALQRKLAAQGCYAGEAHGRFDADTRQALRQFQAGAQLEETGILDEATHEALKAAPPYSFDEVHAAELDAINASRAETGQSPEEKAAGADNAVVRAHQARLLGLALSGGGIRSATFSLGILQTLARLGLLRRVDYLSSVSGGGYIGGWLHAWVNREGGDIRKVEDKLAVPPGAAVHEPRQVSWLRQYSNYLTPRIGLLSADTMAGVTTWLRNVLLNQAMLVTLGLAVLCLPWLLFMGVPWWRDGIALAPLLAGGAALLLASIVVGVMETRAIERAAVAAKISPAASDQTSRRRKARLGTACAAIGAVLLGLVLPFVLGLELELALQRMLLVVLGPPAVLVALMLGVTLGIGLAGRKLREAAREWWSRSGGILLTLLLGWLALTSVALLGSYILIYAGAWVGAMGGILWLATTLAGVILGRSPATGKPAGGWKDQIAAIAPWVFVAGLLLLLSLALQTTLVRSGGEACTEVCTPVPDRSDPGLRAAYRFDQESGKVSQVRPHAGCSLDIYAQRAKQAIENVPSFPLWPLGLCLLAWLLGRRVDINAFAFHMFYRNRLERCYLGASNHPQRRAHPFTDLDMADSPRLDELRHNGHVQRPYPLINTAMNIARSKNLAWQERKAASFLFSPDFCGYQLPGSGDAGVSAYQKTGQFLAPPPQAGMPQARSGWLALGTPMTISGAAASPNAGYHTNPATAFLMTVFNVRLGWWIQNTRTLDHWVNPGPRQSIGYLLKELLANTRDTDDFVHVSDGGHFENLGIYELVRRRCRYIVACDAGCDPHYTFEDLGNAIRKCRIDLGIEISIDPAAIVPDPETGNSRFHCMVGRIHYEQRDPVATPGYLLYIKASLSGNEPTDIKQYRAEHGAFPHESTGDQWYSESQFESYRKLGEHVAGQALQQAQDDAAAGAQSCDLERLFHLLAERWHPPGAAGCAAFSRHGSELEKIYDRMRLDGNLRFLDSQIYPEWVKLANRVTPDSRQTPRGMLPGSGDELRAGFYLCNTLIQLMENVYTDLRLEEEFSHPDNRGWMNLFRHWAGSGMFRVTWAVCIANYGARFQQFCLRHLSLDTGELQLAEATIAVGAAGWENAVNFREKDHVCRIIAGSYAGSADALAGLDPDGIAAIAAAWLRDNPNGMRLRVRLLEMHVSDPFGKEGDFAFPVGFALLETAAAGTDCRLVYFRIQDHLRHMGLGRKGLRKLMMEYPKISLGMPQALEHLIREATPLKLQNLWHLVMWSMR
jgi:peptidoglycan hydrolase-like protein with peptidoglycan-binding domain